eukprot:3385183-Rhodomonas_salina.2
MAGDMQADVKPDIKPDVQPAKGGGDSIQIKVKSPSEGELAFKVKQTTKFSKIFDAYCKNKSIDPSQTRFLFNGERLDREKTPGAGIFTTIHLMCR